ncbi:hypothetical protein L3N51_01505 [Metallosphaera sp. J1]|uniref:hypothetical protein n=1 Tax=Metallosphaera javensis (ex Hofmann et al. 2022) TaxID=99938 RepID=UPI001EDF0E1A|nr:hypothetical protein [Metallosphaera javensis (ex Hofmann et al. 2022)]MCG3109215.1 hypothetical protein [Metallosphaera javensis (ex Hofmann et al. 2022)]
MVKCPYCGYEGEFKELRSPWKFNFYTVRRFECPRCHNPFQYYEGRTKNKERVEFTIRMKRSS